MRLIAPTLVAVLLAAGAHAQQLRMTRPEVEHAEDVDFSALSHYAWKASQDPGDDPAAHAMLVFEIERALGESGLSRATIAAEADLLVRYYTRFDRKLRSTATRESVIRPDNQRTSVGFSRGLEVQLVIELYRPGDERRLWRGSAKEGTSQKRFSEDQIRRAVELILDEYPPATGGGESGPDR